MSIGGDADQHPLRPARLAAQVGDVHQRVDDDAADPDGRGVAQFVDRLRVAVHDDACRIDPGRQRGRQLAARADVEAGAAPARPSARRRCVSSDFAAYTISTPGGRRGSAAAGAEVGFVENISRGAELVGDLGQRHIAHAEPPQVVDGGRQRPDRRVYPGRGGLTQGRQMVEQCHIATVRRCLGVRARLLTAS